MTDTAPRSASGAATTPPDYPHDNLVVLAQQPLVAETRLDLQSETLTSNDRWFIRNHYDVPRLDAATWRLSIKGEVDHPRQLSLDDLRALPTRQIAAVLECAGNARSFLPRPTEGNPFKYGAVSAASFTGVALADVLSAAGLRNGAREIVFRGADRGFEKNVGKEINFERSLPVEIAIHPDTILAYAMNGEPLPVDHGYPVRVVVPGWYGVAAVKWLLEIEAINESFDGYFQKLRYIMPGGPDPSPLQERRVRAVITVPEDQSTLKAGGIEVRGLAWSGNQPVTRVDFSADGGQTWQAAELEQPESPYAWQRWRVVWSAAPGTHVLQVRATDARGRTQPERAEWNLLGYANNGIQRRTVQVHP